MASYEYMKKFKIEIKTSINHNDKLTFIFKK